MKELSDPVKLEIYRPGTELFFVNSFDIRKFVVRNVSVDSGGIFYKENADDSFDSVHCVDTARKAAERFVEICDGKI